MPSLLTLLTIPLLVPGILGGALVRRVDGEKKPGHYIIKTKAPVGSGIASASIASSVNVDPGTITGTYSNVLTGFSATLDESKVEELKNDPNVLEIYEDGRASAQAIVIQNDAPWGLERISRSAKIVQHSNALSYNYTRDDSEGSGVDVYVVDTGINVDHVQFQGRARLGAAFGYASAVDDNGHGTHCAGTIGSLQFGVAKKANLIAVKVLDSDGNGWNSDIISAFDWIIAQAAASGRPSVVSYSIGGGRDSLMDAAAQAVVSSGVHLVVAAGNSNIPVSQTSPGTVANVVTVGAIDINDAKAGFSNYGPEVDIHAAGVSVISTYIGSTTATASLSGTSMATPHVSGLIAYFIALHGNMSPQAMGDFIKGQAIKGAISGLPGDTANNLAFNGVETLKKRGHVLRKDLHSGPARSRRDRFAKKSVV